MKKLILSTALFTVILSSQAFAQPENPHAQHEIGGKERAYFPEDYKDVDPTPKKGQEIQKYAVSDDPNSGQKNFGVQLVHDNMIFYQFMGNRLEQRFQQGDNALLFDAQAWVGTDYDKLWLKTEGEYNTNQSDFETVSHETLYSRTIAPFWDIQAGWRHDFIPEADDRDFFAFGFQGLAPYRFEIDTASYVSDEGDISVGLEAEFDIRLTQRAVIQPRFETEIAVQDVEEYNIGSGITGFETGLRLRYEVSRKFAPYVGVSWEQNVGETKNFLREDGEMTNNTAFVTGVRFWF